MRAVEKETVVAPEEEEREGSSRSKCDTGLS
jgi:hypothetical protein